MQHKIDRRVPICGIRPAVLKRLFLANRNYMFSLQMAAKVFGESESDARKRLHNLHCEGWIDAEGMITEHEGQHYPGLWQPTEKGMRLSAMPMNIKRFPVSEGRKIVEQVIKLATQINTEDHNSHRIETIILFGSVLTGHDNDDAGDVDLWVDTRLRRDISLEEVRELARRESEGRAYRQTYYHWGSILLLRRIKKISPRISLVNHIEPEYPQKVVYQFLREAPHSLR